MLNWTTDIRDYYFAIPDYFVEKHFHLAKGIRWYL